VWGQCLDRVARQFLTGIKSISIFSETAADGAGIPLPPLSINIGKLISSKLLDGSSGNFH